jgi:hypothetical protein
VGAQAQSYNTHPDPLDPAPEPRQGILHPRTQYMYNLEEATRTRQLLREPVVNDIEGLHHPNFAMGPSNSTMPDPPWFAKPNIPSMPTITTVDAEGNTLILPYIQYALINHKPVLLGSKGRSEEVFRDYLKAGAKNHLPLPSSINNIALKDLYIDYPFNWMLNLAPYHLSNAGIIADIHQYRLAYLKLKLIKWENQQIM